MAKLKVNKEKCINCGACYSMYPDKFKLGEDGKSEVIEGTEFTDAESEEAISLCPVQAIEKSEE